MIIQNATIILTSEGRLTGEFFNCDITCDFDLYSGKHTAPKIFEIRDYFEDKSKEYIKVFSGVKSMTLCVIKGTDKKGELI